MEEDEDYGLPSPLPICYGSPHLFIAEDTEVKNPDTSDSYAGARAACVTRCAHMVACAKQGVRHGDRHSVRAGQRTWIPEEWEELLKIAEA